MKNTVLTIAALLLCGCAEQRGAFTDITDATPKDTTETEVVKDLHSDGRKAELLSAFFGLDSALPRGLNLFLNQKVGGKDGMPVVFSHELDVNTLQAGDFKVTTTPGKVGELTCVTLAPANDEGELRTVLLVGEYGSIDDQPAKVEVVGNLLSIDQEVNFKGNMLRAELIPYFFTKLIS